MGVSDAEFEAWIGNRRAERLVLVEIDHFLGTVLLASDDWISDAADGYRPYDGNLVAPLVLEEDLEDFAGGVGDVTALNTDPAVHWPDLAVRGHEARWLVGDRAWARADFRPIATVLSDGVRAVDGRIATFELSTAGSLFGRRPSGADETRTGTAQSVIEALVADVGATAPTFTNVPPARLAWQVSIELTQSTTLGEALERVVQSVHANVRVRRGGRIDVFVSEALNELEIEEDDIVGRKIEELSVRPARSRVVLEYGADSSVERTPVLAGGGVYESEVVIPSALVSATDAGALADLEAVRYGQDRRVRELRLSALAHRLELGTRVGVTHEDWSGSGIVRAISREPDSAFSTVEVIS